MGGLIRSFKYQRALCLEEEALQRLVLRFSQEYALRPPTVIVPLAMDPERMRTRGMDHALRLASMLQRVLFPDVPVVQALSRTRTTRTNAQLASAEAKAANVREVFAVDKHLSCQRVLLVDDVYTTGATLCEAANTILKAVPDAAVHGFVFACVETSG